MSASETVHTTSAVNDDRVVNTVSAPMKKTEPYSTRVPLHRSEPQPWGRAPWSLIEPMTLENPDGLERAVPFTSTEVAIETYAQSAPG